MHRPPRSFLQEKKLKTVEKEELSLSLRDELKHFSDKETLSFSSWDETSTFLLQVQYNHPASPFFAQILLTVTAERAVRVKIVPEQSCQML